MKVNGYCHLMPAQPQDTPVIWSYDIMKKEAGKLPWYTKVDLSEDVALQLAELSPYPRGVKLGIRKQLANDKKITLRQMRILLAWAANKAQR